MPQNIIQATFENPANQNTPATVDTAGNLMVADGGSSGSK
jgi:hypothetical protein